jgi:opacity protein-like surface antigen
MNALRLIAISAAAVVAAHPAQAQTWYTAPSSWYVGAAGGPSNIDITCDAGACDRSSTAWKVYGGFRFPNRTGAELLYVDVGDASADSLHHTNLVPGKVEGSYWALAGVWSPEFGNGLLANLKLGIAGSDSKTSGLDAGVAAGSKRSLFPHVYAAAGIGWKLNGHLEFTADYDYSRLSYRNMEAGSDHHLKQTVDVGAVMVGVNYGF